MEYLPPVINHVHNKLNTHLTLKLNYVRYSVPAKDTTVLDFDLMSRAAGPEREDLYNAIRDGYIAVDILVLKNGEYSKVGEYEVSKTESNVVVKPIVSSPKKSEDMAEKLGITVKDIEVKKEAVNEIKEEEKPALDPIKTINNPKARKAVESQTKKAEVKTALENVKDKAKEDK